jgi:hypothetical protein
MAALLNGSPVNFLSRKYGQQRKRVSRQNGREPF